MTELELRIVSNYDQMIKNEIHSIQQQRQIIEKWTKLHFNLSRIIVRDARGYIQMSQESIKLFIELRTKIIQPKQVQYSAANNNFNEEDQPF